MSSARPPGARGEGLLLGDAPRPPIKPASSSDENGLLGDAPPRGAGGSLEEVLPSGHVPVVDDAGELTSVPERDYERALASGYRFQTAEEQKRYRDELKYGGTGQQAKTALEGVAKGLTLGMSTPLETSLGIASAEDIKGREEVNPVAAGLGEVAGAILPEFIPGVGEVMAPKLASSAGRLGARLLTGGAESTVGRIGEKALAGALEGSLFGVGNSVSEATLGDPDLNAQKVIANIGLGSVLGAGGGAMGGFIEEAAGPALKKLAKSTGDVEGFLRGVSNEQAIKAMGGIQSDINRLVPDPAERTRLARMLMERGHIGGSPAEALESVRADMVETAKKLGAELQVPELVSGEIHHALAGGEGGAGLETLEKALDKHGGVISKILTQADANGAAANPASIWLDIRRFGDSLDPVQRGMLEPHLQTVKGALQEAAEKGLGFEKLNAMKSTLMGSAGFDAETGGAVGRLKRQVAHIFKESLDAQLEPQIGGQLAAEFRDAKRLYGLLASARDALESKNGSGTGAIAAMLERAGHDTDTAKTFGLLSKAEQMGLKGANRNAGNRFFSLGDRLEGMVAAGVGSTVGGPLGALVGQKTGEVVSRLARTRGPAFVAQMSNWIAETPAALALAEHFGKSVSKVINHLGEFGPVMASALASGPARAMATHLMLGRESPAYRERAALAGFPAQNPEEEAVALERSQHLGALGVALREQDEALGRHVDRIIKGEAPARAPRVETKQDFGSRQMRREKHDAHKQHVDDVMSLAADPNKLAERVAGNIGPLSKHTPELATSMSATAARAVRFLSSKAKKPSPAGPLAREWTPSRGEVAKFSRYLEATQKPSAVLRHAAAGTLTPEHVEALKAVYPALYEDIRSKVAEGVTGGKRVSRRARIMIQILTGIDADGSVSPASIARNQAVFAAPSRRPSQQASPGTSSKPTQSGMAKLTLAGRSQTRTQATESREG